MDEGETSDRPNKIRKLSHSGSNGPQPSSLPSDTGSPQNILTTEPRNQADLPDVDSLLPQEPCIEDEQEEANQTEQSVGDQTTQDPPLTKSALKKLRKKEQWEAGREDRKIKRKEKRKERQQRQKEERKTVPREERKRKTESPPQEKIPVTFIIDASFDSLMTEKEIVSLAAQITRCYHSAKTARYRPELAVSSFGARLKTRFDTVLGGLYKQWKDVHMLEDDLKTVGEEAQSWMEKTKASQNGDSSRKVEDVTASPGLIDSSVGPPQDTAQEAQDSPSLVYLSAESQNVLTSLKPGTSYVIGGLIDRNRYKGHCFGVAEKAGIATARLPIDEYIKMSDRKVLATNHVVEIMIRYLETKDWGKSFLEVIPARKGVNLKDSEERGDADENMEKDLVVEEEDSDSDEK